MKTIEEADNEFLRLVGDKIKERRKNLGMNQEKLAELASVHLTYISHLECGKSNGSVLVYRRIAAALHVPLVKLLDVGITSLGPDELMRTVMDIKSLNTKEQKMILKAIKGLVAGVKGEG